MPYFVSQRTVKRSLLLFPIVGGAVIAGICALLLMSLEPLWLTLLCGAGLASLPALLVKDPIRYWLALFLLVLPLNLSKAFGGQERLASLLETVGGTWGSNTLILQASDLPLFMLLALWGIRHALRREPIFFPLISYLPLGYLVWVTLGAVFAPYPWLSFFELIREYKFFVIYLFTINNVDPKTMSKLIIGTLLLGLLLQGGLTLVKYKSQKVENLFVSLGFGQAASVDEGGDAEKYRFESVAEEGSAEEQKRGVGTLPHPTGTAMHLELTLPLALTLFLLEAMRKEKWLYLSLFLLGSGALYTTFSRGGMLGALFSFLVCISVLARRGSLSKTFIVGMLSLTALLTVLTAVKLHSYLTTRPKYLNLHFEHLKTGMAMLQINPITGVGLNNSTFLRPQFTPGGESQIEQVLPIHSHYLLGLIETGVVGFGLYSAFFILLIFEALNRSRSRDFYAAVFAIAILSAYSALALHTIVDYAGGDALQTLLWFYAGLLIAMRRSGPDTQPQLMSPAP
jgi:hypothetical protein